jgi:hypothetical protein
MAMYKLHTVCRACGYGAPPAPGIKSGEPEKLIPVFDLGLQPLANDFKREGDEHAGFVPLKVLFCPRCTLAQLSVVVDPKILYANYPYVTSPSATMQEHFTRLIADIRQEQAFDQVLEIGSNDGALLRRFQKEGASHVLGVDPAFNLTQIANNAEITTLTMQFNSFAGHEIVGMDFNPDVIIARHVFCHVDDWHDFIRGLEILTTKNTLICIEVPYVGKLLAGVEFDTCYHEHLSYFSLKALEALLKHSELYVHKVLPYSIHGGAMMLMLRRKSFSTSSCVLSATENITIKHWENFAVESKNQINRLRQTVMASVAQGKRVAGLGASAKSTVWVNACGFSRKEIQFIADNTPQKQLCFSPGTDIPIVDEGAILRELPDYVILWAWNYKDEILEKFKRARELGVKFIIPVPTIQVV